jgi:hypothetical protein
MFFENLDDFQRKPRDVCLTQIVDDIVEWLAEHRRVATWTEIVREFPSVRLLLSMNNRADLVDALQAQVEGRSDVCPEGADGIAYVPVLLRRASPQAQAQLRNDRAFLDAFLLEQLQTTPAGLDVALVEDAHPHALATFAAWCKMRVAVRLSSRHDDGRETCRFLAGIPPPNAAAAADDIVPAELRAMWSTYFEVPAEASEARAALVTLVGVARCADVVATCGRSVDEARLARLGKPGKKRAVALARRKEQHAHTDEAGARAAHDQKDDDGEECQDGAAGENAEDDEHGQRQQKDTTTRPQQVTPLVLAPLHWLPQARRRRQTAGGEDDD